MLINVRTCLNGALIAALTFGTLGLAGCGEPAEPIKQPPADAPVSGASTSGTGTQTDQASARPYPLDVCIVSDEELGTMGDVPTLVHEGQLYKFCCDACVPTFKKDPAKYAAKLSEKAKAAPADTMPAPEGAGDAPAGM